MAENKIISFKKAKEYFDKTHCKHLNIEVDKDLWMVKCLDCGQYIDPVEWLYKHAEEQSLWEYKIDELKQTYDKMMSELNERNRCKCENCGKMTRIIK